MRALILPTLCILLIAGACGPINNLADSIRGAGASVSNVVGGIDTTGARLTAKILDTMTASRSRERLDSLIRSMAASAVQGMRDTLSSERSKRELDSLVGSLVSAARDSLTNGNARFRLDSLLNTAGANIERRLQNIRTELLDDATLDRLAVFRDELVGQKLRKAVDSLISSGADTLVYDLDSLILPRLHREEKTASNVASSLIWQIFGGVLAVALIIILFLYWTHLKLNKLLVSQIDQTPNQSAYDELTRRIQEAAINLGVERTLRRILNRQGINPSRLDEHEARNKSLMQRLNPQK